MGLDDLGDMLGLTKPGDEENEKDEKDEKDAEAGSEEGSEDAEAKDDSSEDEGDAGDGERESGDDETVVRSDVGGDRETESSADAEDDEGGDDPEALKKQNVGLRKEIAKLREQAKLSRFAPPQQNQQPVAPAAQQTTQVTRPMIPVRVSEDGREVYVDPDALDRLIEERAAAAAARAAAPTPEQIISNEVRIATEQFVSENPTNVDVVKRVKEVDEFLTFHVAQLVQEGYQIRSVHDAVQALEAKGIDQQVLNAYPELKGIGFSDFFEQMSDGRAAARRVLLRTIAASQPSAPKPRQRTANGAKRPLGDQPRSLTRKGGGKATAATSDEREFKDLEARFRESGISLKDFPEKDYKRMSQLGKKLGIEGFV